MPWSGPFAFDLTLTSPASRAEEAPVPSCGTGVARGSSEIFRAATADMPSQPALLTGHL